MVKTRQSRFKGTLRAHLSLIIISLLTLSDGRASNDLQFRPPDIFWEKTTLDFDFFNRKVNTGLCHKSETIFLSCIESIRAVLQHDGSNLELVWLSWWEKIANFWNIRKSFGAVQVIQQQQIKDSNPTDTLKRIRERRSRILAWRDLYRSGLDERVDFSGMREWVLTSVVDHSKSASYAASAINGYLRAQDPHAQIIPATVLFDQTKARPNRYFGIGISLHRVGNSKLIGRVVKDSPAFKVGLRSNDEIYSIDGEVIEDKRVEDVVAMLRGPRRSGVVVKVKRDGETHRFLIIRDEVEINNVSHEVIRDQAQRWGHIRIKSFAASNTCNQVRDALSKLGSSNVTGLILDIRDNMGGLVAQSACVADLFLEPNLVVLEMRSVNGSEYDHVVRTRSPRYADFFMVTLVNSSSGSASEILAGALQDHRRSLIVGERTFGKGSIQLPRPWGYSSSIMQMYTAARYFLPSGRTIQFVGITPDSEVLRSPMSREQDLLALREADLFPIALPTTDDKWKQPRTAQVDTVENCIKQLGVAEQRMNRNTDSSKSLDYQLYYAQDALACIYINQII